MTFVAFQKIRASQLNDLILASGSVNAAATTAGSDTTTSATYVNLAGTGSSTSFSITKRQGSATNLRITMAAGCWTNTAVAVVRFGVLVNGTDYDVCQLSLPTTLEHEPPLNGSVDVPGLAAGAYTIQGRWRRVSGTGTLTRDVNDWLSISAEEVSV